MKNRMRMAGDPTRLSGDFRNALLAVLTIAVVVWFLGILAADSNGHSSVGGQLQFAIGLAMLAGYRRSGAW
jgi:hypothetical protein